MKEALTTALVNLLKVKTLVTFAVIAVFVAMALRGDLRGEDVMTVAATVVAFYFGTQAERGR